MGWILTHSTSESAALDLMQSRSKPPVGIIFIGGSDNTIKTIATAISSRSLSTRPHTTYDIITSSELASLPQGIFEVNHFVIINLLSGLSGNPRFRHEVVRELRQRGAKNVIMIWIRETSRVTTSSPVPSTKHSARTRPPLMVSTTFSPWSPSSTTPPA